MELKFADRPIRWGFLSSVCFLEAILCAAIAALDWLSLLPFALAGGVIPLLAPLLPRKYRRKALFLLLGAVAAFLLIRFFPIVNGLKCLANRLFQQSAQRQSYEYDSFSVSGDTAPEAALFLSLLLGAGAALWGNRFNGILAAILLLAMIYFGVTPALPYLAALTLTAAWAMLPGGGRALHALGICLLVVAIALAAQRIAPEPNAALSAWDEQLRDLLAGAPITYQQTPIPTQVPEPEIVPAPDQTQEQPDHGVIGSPASWLALGLVLLTALLLFVPAVFRDMAEKRRRKNRAMLDAPDPKEAIRALYLYAKKWERASSLPLSVPPQIYALWQEAAYSDHPMTADQREQMRRYAQDTAAAVWKASSRKKKWIIRYKLAL